MTTKTLPLLSMCAMAAMLIPLAVHAQDAGTPAPTVIDVNQLVAQLAGDAPAPSRSDSEMRTVYALVVDHFFPLIAAEDFEARYEHQLRFSHIAAHAGRRGAEKERYALGAAMAARLDSRTPHDARVWLARQLETMGGPECVSALSACLSDPSAELRDVARRALEANSSSTANGALLAALRDAKDPATRIGLMASLGQRRTAAAVPLLAAALEDHDAALAAASALALSKIADADSVSALEAAYARAHDARKDALAHALLDAAVALERSNDPQRARALYASLFENDANPPIRAAALGGLARVAPGAYESAVKAFQSGHPVLQSAAVQFARNANSRPMTKALADALGNAAPALQLQILGLLADQGTPDTQPTVIAALGSSDEAVRLAAIQAAGKVGDAAVATALLQAATRGGADEQAALAGLAALRGRGVPEAIESAAAEGPVPVRVAAVKAIAVRGGKNVPKQLAGYTHDPDVQVARAALDGLAGAGTEKQIGMLAEALVTAGDSMSRAAAQRALAAVARRTGTADAAAENVARSIEGLNADAAKTALETLRILGSPNGLSAVVAAIGAENEVVRDAAIRQLCDWPGYPAVEPLLALAAAEVTSLNYHVLALRGITRLLGADEGPPAAKRLAHAKAALDATRRGEEARQILEVLATSEVPAAADVILPLLDNAELSRYAAASALDLAKRLQEKDTETCKAIAGRLAAAGLEESITREAKLLIGK